MASQVLLLKTNCVYLNTSLGEREKPFHAAQWGPVLRRQLCEVLPGFPQELSRHCPVAKSQRRLGTPASWISAIHDVK